MEQLGRTSTGRHRAITGDGLESYIARLAAGDAPAMTPLYEETRAAVFGFLISIVKSPHEAEDLLHDTYIKVWESAEGYRRMGKPMAWILTIAKNLALSGFRERERVSDLPEEEWGRFLADAPAVTSEDRIVLRAAMGELTEEERRVVMLHAVSGLKHREIAELLDLPLPTVLSKYHRAKKKLAAIILEGEAI